MATHALPFRLTAAACAVIALLAVTACLPARAQTATTGDAAQPPVQTLERVTIRASASASADASAGGLTAPYAGAQVARGGRVGILGSQDVMTRRSASPTTRRS